MLGHGSDENRSVPRLVQGLTRVVVEDIAIGKNCVFALTSNGVLYGWGDSSHGQLGVVSDEVPAPTVVPMVTSRSILSVYPGTNQVFCKLSSLSDEQDSSTQRPFCVDVQKDTFCCLDKLLKMFVAKLESSQPGTVREEDNCLLLATLSLLRLQVWLLCVCVCVCVCVCSVGTLSICTDQYLFVMTCLSPATHCHQ